MPGAVYARGDRVTLRTVEKEDAEFLQRGYNHPDIRSPLGYTGPWSRGEIEDEIEEAGESDDTVVLLACLDDEPIGAVTAIHISFGRPGITYWIVPEQQGNGYGSEAVELFLDAFFRDYDVHGVKAHVFDYNEASQALLESLGFREEAHMLEARYRNGEYVDEFIYGLLRREWEE